MAARPRRGRPADRAGSRAVLAGRLSRAAATGVPGRTGEIGAIYLLPDAWGKGVGRRLMGAVLERLAAAGIAEVTLWVLDSDVRARRFYEAGGWSPDGAVKCDESRGFPIPEVRYRRSLP